VCQQQLDCFHVVVLTGYVHGQVVLMARVHIVAGKEQSRIENDERSNRMMIRTNK
jgi:hypothetical protein